MDSIYYIFICYRFHDFIRSRLGFVILNLEFGYYNVNSLGIVRNLEQRYRNISRIVLSYQVLDFSCNGALKILLPTKDLRYLRVWFYSLQSNNKLSVYKEVPLLIRYY